MIPRPHPAVIFKPVSEGAVLLHTETEIYFGLNHVGAQIWELLAEAPVQLDGIIDSLREAYPEVERSDLRADVEELLDSLTENGLLVVANGNHASSPAPA